MTSYISSRRPAAGPCLFIVPMGRAVWLTRLYRACCKRLVGPDGTFYLFTELPSEIRLMVWRECLPSQIHLVAERIHEGDDALQVCEWHHMTGAVESSARVWATSLDILESNFTPRVARDILYDSVVDTLLPEYPRDRPRAYPYHSRNCNPAYPILLVPNTPVIAKVNREARVLAFEGRGKGYNLAFVHRNLSDRMDRIEESLVLVNPKDDTVLINTQFVTAARHPAEAAFLTEDGDLEHKANRLLGMITRTSIQVAIFAGVLTDSDVPPQLYHALADAKRVDVVVGVLRFHRVSNSEATTTDLFGLMGDQSTALIPARDPQCLRKLFMAHVAFRPDCVAEYFVPGDADYINSAWIPDEYSNWDRPRRPSDLDAYCEEMLGFAEGIMTACKAHLMARLWEGPDGEYVTRQWHTNVEAAFRDTFEPVFLAHRCLNPVLIDSTEQEDD